VTQTIKRRPKTAKPVETAACGETVAVAPQSKDASLQADIAVTGKPALVRKRYGEPDASLFETAVEDLAPKPVGGDVFFYVDNLDKWKSLTNFTVSYEDVSDYWRPRIKQRSIFMDAVAKAAEYFEKKGALAPIRFSDDAIEIHVHPKTYAVVFLFKRAVAGRPLECEKTYELTPDMVGWLKATGRWKDLTEH
jgi:hypothetical protein